MSTFHGLEMAKQALSAQQAGLYTTGHNISNANTEGYSRQRVNFNTSTPYPAIGKNRPEIPGQKGTGVDVGSVERIRNEYLDKQYRTENSRAGFWDSKSQALSRMEELLNEPSESGLSHTINQLWDSLEELSVHPNSDGARSVVAQRGLAVTDTFNHLAESLYSIQDDLNLEIDSSVDDVNSLLKQINRLNEQVKQIEPHGDVANDLYDQRDLLIDELSEMISIEVTYEGVGGNAKSMAQGVASIELVDAKGGELDPQIQLIDGEVDYDDDYFEDFITVVTESQTGPVTGLQFKGEENETISAEDFIDQSTGKLTSLIESLGYDSGNETRGEYPEIIDSLNQMAHAMADTFNDVHRLEENGQEFFKYDEDSADFAHTVTVRDDILDDPSLINANTDGNNGENARNLARVFSTELDDLNGNTVTSYFDQIIGYMGVTAQEANRMSDNTDTLRAQIDGQRMSLNAVSLDEEMTNVIQFQHAYNAAARSMTAIDEMLDTIINGMGLVGR